MSNKCYRPRRRLRGEIFPLSVAMALPIALYLAFPGDAIGFAPANPAKAKTTINSCIELSPERESELLKSARASWQSDTASRRGRRANLLACDFTEQNARIASGFVPLPSERADSVTEYELDALPVGVAAPAPANLPVDTPIAPVPVFSKAELLKLD